MMALMLVVVGVVVLADVMLLGAGGVAGCGAGASSSARG